VSRDFQPKNRKPRIIPGFRYMHHSVYKRGFVSSFFQITFEDNNDLLLHNMYHTTVMRPKISIIVPVFNEKGSLELLMKELRQALSQLGDPFEILFIDDGSSDGGREILEKFARENAEVKFIGFKRNFGQTAAILAGVDHSQGEYLIPMDADLQNDPKDIPRLLEKIREGFDIVSGWRKNRKDKLLRTFCSKIANKFLAYFLQVKIHDYGCTLKVYRSEVLKGIRLYGEMHRFLPAIASWDGANVTEMVVNHRMRKFGKSKYSLRRIRPVFLDLIAMKFFASYVQKPIRVFGRLSLWAFTLGTLSLFKTGFDKIYFAQDITNTPYLLISVFLFIVSLQLMAFGLLCEVQIRTYYESQGKKIYRIDKTLNIR